MRVKLQQAGMARQTGNHGVASIFKATLCMVTAGASGNSGFPFLQMGGFGNWHPENQVIFHRLTSPGTLTVGETSLPGVY